MKEKTSETMLSPQCEQRMIVRRKYSLTSSIQLRTMHERWSVYQKSMRNPSLESESFQRLLTFRSSIEEQSKIVYALEVTLSGKNTTHRRPGRRRLPPPPYPCFCSCQAFSFSPRLFFFLQTYVHFFSSVTRSIRFNILVDQRNS